MQCKAILTYSGTIIPSLEQHIAAAIPFDSSEWRRSHGRPIKNVKISACFQKFSTEILDRYRKGDWNIIEHPVLHIYVTDCTDVDTYKNSIKDEIDGWLKILTEYGITDWMIILVETVDVKKTKNILPRTTVLDKMRLDFGAKHIDRCISVLNPIKNELKATESFRCLLQRIRHLILTGYNKNIIKYEELIRANREKRNHDGWTFMKYFLLQEQLAFVLEMLGLHIEALMQYDELDAMLSQFILNSSFNGDAQKWLEIFQQPLNSFHGITMNAKKMYATRQKIIANSVNLLEFRSYIFERQATLLNAADLTWEIAERLLPFLFGTLREIEALKIDAPDGALACWQIVCSLEVLQLCERATTAAAATGTSAAATSVTTEQSEIGNVFQYTAPIWNLAKDKLYELGKLCGLLPGFSPTSAQLHTVVQLSAGIGDSFLDEEAVLVERPIEKDRKTHSPSRRPKQPATDRLKEALGSNNAFQKLYLELSELAISTYKHVSRLRSARLVGLDLGNFYCSLSEPNKAVGFFTDLLRELKSENWNYLASQTLLELANCYRKMNDSVSYTKTCAAISCCIDLEILVRTFYFDEFLLSLKTIQCVPDAKIDRKAATGDDTAALGNTEINDDASIENELQQKSPPQSNNMFATLDDHFSVIDIQVKRQNDEQIIQDEFIFVELKFDSHFPREILADQIALSFEMHAKPVATVPNETIASELINSAILPMTTHLDYKQDKSLSCASVVCNTKGKHPIRRTSSTTRRKISPTIRDDFTNNVNCSNIVIKPGSNTIELKCKATRVGLWNFKQLSIVVQKLEFLSETLPQRLTINKPFEITTKPATVILSFKNLIAGIIQPIDLIIFGGSFIFPRQTTITMRCSKGLKMRISKENDAAANENEFQIELIQKLTDFKSFEERTIHMEAICDLPGQKDEKHIEHFVIVHCPWSRTELQIPIHFMPPLNASCRLHSSETRKFLQVIVRGIESKLLLTNARMSCDYRGVNLKDKNPKTQTTIQCYKGLNVSYIWEIEVEPLKAEGELPIIKVGFTIDYAHISMPNHTRTFGCKFDVQDYTTLFRIHAKVEPSELCRVGSVCHLNLKITKIQDNPFGELMYEVLADQNTWAVCGRTAGVVSMLDVDAQSVTLDVLPLSAGFLPMPIIRLSKYISADKSRTDIHPKLHPFPPGQVYNSTKSMQIHVLAGTNVDG